MSKTVAKAKKTNIHLDTHITNVVKASYQERRIVDTVMEVKTFLQVSSLSENIWYRIYVDEEMQPGLWDKMGYDEAAHKGYDRSFILHPAIGATVKIEAYRVPETFDTAQYIGCCAGTLTDQGYVIAGRDNVTTQEKNEVRKSRR